MLSCEVPSCCPVRYSRCLTLIQEGTINSAESLYQTHVLNDWDMQSHLAFSNSSLKPLKIKCQAYSWISARVSVQLKQLILWILSWVSSLWFSQHSPSLCFACSFTDWTINKNKSSDNLEGFLAKSRDLAGPFWRPSRTPNSNPKAPVDSLRSVDQNRLFEQPKWTSDDWENRFLLKAVFLGILQAFNS